MKLIYQTNHKLRLRRQNTLDYPLHLHRALELVWVKKGDGEVICDSSRFSLTAGDFLVLLSDRVHGFEQSREMDVFIWIVPMEPYLDFIREKLEQKILPNPIFKRGSWEKTGISDLLELAWRDWKDASETVRRGYTTVLLGKLLSFLPLEEESRCDSQNALSAVLRYVNGHYKEPITRKEIAREVGYHESYLSHLFSEEMNLTLTDYLASLRVSEAISLLKGTSLPISTIAFSLGFGSIRSFNRSFAKFAHTSPRNCRKE